MTRAPNRLAVLFAAASAVVVWRAAATAALPQSPTSRPNILLLIADDWGWPHAGAYGDRVVRTPSFDRIAREGALFRHAFSAAPSCTPSRASLLTGRAVHALEAGGNLHSALPATFAVYPDLLEQAGYAVGFTRKGWGPGDFKAAGRTLVGVAGDSCVLSSAMDAHIRELKVWVPSDATASMTRERNARAMQFLDESLGCDVRPSSCADQPARPA